MIEIHLEGSHTAKYGEIEVTRQKKSPIPVLLRKLVSEGHCIENEEVKIMRGPINCFKTTTVGYWTAIDYRDDDKTGLVKTKYVPFEPFD